MWVRSEDRLPEKKGEYKVIRRAGRCSYFGGKKSYYEDICTYEDNGYWRSEKGIRINTVEWWWHENQIVS